jgi:hypothetical protein
MPSGRKGGRGWKGRNRNGKPFLTLPSFLPFLRI